MKNINNKQVLIGKTIVNFTSDFDENLVLIFSDKTHVKIEIENNRGDYELHLNTAELSDKEKFRLDLITKNEYDKIMKRQINLKRMHDKRSRARQFQILKKEFGGDV